MSDQLIHHRGIDFTGLILGGSNAVGNIEAPLVDYDPDGTQNVIQASAASPACSVAFPFTCTLRSGKHLVQYRVAGDHDWTSTGVVKLRSSTDDMASWSASSTMLDNAGEDDNAGGLCQLPDGTVLGMVVRRPTSTQSGWYSQSMRSTDEGATWDAPVTLDAGASGFEYVTHVISLPNGEALAFVYCNSGGEDYIVVMATTDGGDTWSTRGSLVGSSGQHFQEPQAVLMPDGELLIFIRYNSGGTHEIRMARSVDNGETWTTPATIITGASGQPAPFLTRNGVLLVTYRDMVGGGMQCRWASSVDRGNTWELRGNWTADTDVYVYAGWLHLSDGDVGLTYSLEQLANDLVSDLYSMRFDRVLDLDVPAPAAEDVAVDDSSFTELAGGDVQEVLEAVDAALAAGIGSSTRWEVVLIGSPPEPVLNPAGDDWLYIEVPI